MPQLPVELYGQIAKGVLAKKTEHGRLDSLSARQDQRHLTDLLLVLRAVKEQTLSVLYEDCLVTNIDSFAQALEGSASHFRHTRRLRFAHLELTRYDFYSRLFQEQHWDFLLTRVRPGEAEPGSIAGMAGEMEGCSRIANYLLDTDGKKDGSLATIFPKLERVVMDASDCPDWQHMFDSATRYSPRPRHIPGVMPLPIYMLRYGHVKHYCQSSMWGTYALPLSAIKTRSGLQTVTYHLPPRFFKVYPDLPVPIVHGWHNRYICLDGERALARASAVGKDDLPHQMRRQLEPILRMLCVPLAVQNSGGPLPKSCLEILKTTTIELVGQLRTIVVQDKDFVDAAMNPTNPRLVRSPPLSLDPLQQYLDSLIAPYHGRITVKNLEDASPCPACDLDPAAQWRESQKQGIWNPPATATRIYEAPTSFHFLASPTR